MKRVCGWLLAAAAAFCPVPAARAAEPVKDATTRHNYDFTQPGPGEILPNPNQGVGTPPALRDYVTVHKMSDEPGQTAGGAPRPAAPAEDAGPSPGAAGGTLPTGGPPPTGSSPPAGAPTPARESPPKAAAAPPPPAAPNPPRGTPASPPVPTTADYVRLDLAEQVAAKGVAGPFAYRPSAAAQADPARKVAEEAAFERDVAVLAASWQAWQAAHPSLRPLATAPTMPSHPTVVEARPGRLVLSGAPASVTGDFPPDAVTDPIPPPGPERALP
ncbi:MAG TPA: hypothetical protein VH414_15955 [Lichenihabitans sp.]|jgi:hypothetical protein|nr:hypothetical protein [Lichenihabitans sp.]